MVAAPSRRSVSRHGPSSDFRAAGPVHELELPALGVRPRTPGHHAGWLTPSGRLGLKAPGDETLLPPCGPALESAPQACAPGWIGRRARKGSELDTDADSRVRFRVAFAMGETNDPRATAALARIARADVANRWIRAAVLSSCATTADRLLVDRWQDTSRAATASDPPRAELLRQLAEIVGARNRPDEVGRVLDELAADGETRACCRARARPADSVVLALARRRRRAVRWRSVRIPSGGGRPGRIWPLGPDGGPDECARIGSTGDRSLGRDRAGTRSLPDLPGRASRSPCRSPWCRPGTGPPGMPPDLLGRRRIRAGGQAQPPSDAPSRAEWTKALLRGVQGGGGGSAGLSPTLIEPADRAPLLKHRDPEIARLAQAVFGQATTQSRARVLADYLAVLRTKGDAGRGAKVFER